MNSNRDQLTFDHINTHRRHRVMLKLETLWGLYSDKTFGQLIWALPNNIAWSTSDDEFEKLLDNALDAAGATVSGGWKS